MMDVERTGVGCDPGLFASGLYLLVGISACVVLDQPAFETVMFPWRLPAPPRIAEEDGIVIAGKQQAVAVGTGGERVEGEDE